MFTSSSFSISGEEGVEGENNDESEDELDDPWRSPSEKIAWVEISTTFPHIFLSHRIRSLFLLFLRYFWILFYTFYDRIRVLLLWKILLLFLRRQSNKVHLIRGSIKKGCLKLWLSWASMYLVNNCIIEISFPIKYSTNVQKFMGAWIGDSPGSGRIPFVRIKVFFKWPRESEKWSRNPSHTKGTLETASLGWMLFFGISPRFLYVFAPQTPFGRFTASHLLWILFSFNSRLLWLCSKLM